MKIENCPLKSVNIECVFPECVDKFEIPITVNDESLFSIPSLTFVFGGDICQRKDHF